MSDKGAGGKAIADMSFEEALKALEGVVEALEGGQVPLETSLDLYERGETLRRHCEDRLKAAELRVEKIVASNGQATGTTPFASGASKGGPDDESPF